MAKYAAFLRGINVGGRTIKMTELKACFEKLGFQSVSTLLQTGNVIFETDKAVADLKNVIENGLADNFHYPIRVQIYSWDRLKAIVASSPFRSDDTHHSYVLFFENKLERQLIDEVAERNNKIETIEGGDGVIYWKVPIGSTLKSHFARYLTKAAYKNFHTNRNIKTLQKIIDA